MARFVETHQRSVVIRLKSARGQIGGIFPIIEVNAYCPDVTKQLPAVQGLLEGASRIMLRRHPETCTAKAMQEGRTTEIVDELMETLKFAQTAYGNPPPGHVSVHDVARPSLSPVARPLIGFPYAA
jgi:CsoR family transcriptional regulator, copper-sensing transcriptional repressor